MDRLARKFETARQHVPTPVIEPRPRRQDRPHRLRHVALGHRRRAAISCARRPSVKTSYFRLRAYPFTDELVERSSTRTSASTSIEQNRDAQLLQLMKLDLDAGSAVSKLRSVLHYNGLPIDARSITDDVLAQEGFEVAKKTTGRA